MQRLLQACAFGTVSFAGIAFLSYIFKKRKSTIHIPHMKLYMYPEFRSNRCIWLLYELGIKSDVEYEELDPREKFTEGMSYYREHVHPHGTIPALVLDGQQAIVESGAICLYLADLYQKFVPETQDRRDYYNWIIYCCSTLDEMMEHIFLQLLLPPNKQDRDVLQKNMQKFDVFAKYLNSHLLNRQYICGDKFTAADCVLGYNLWWASVMRNGAMLKNYPEILDYFSRLQSRTCFMQTFS